MNTADKATDMAMKYADEIKRLRAALEQIAKIDPVGDSRADDYGRAAKIARAALERSAW